MSCCNRPTFAISIGVLHSILSLVVAICCTIGLANIDRMHLEADDVEYVRTIMWVVLSLCLFTIAFSLNMVVGVVMKRHKMMSPYLRLGICGAIIYVSTSLFLTCWCLSTGEPSESLERVLIRCALVVVLQCVILRPVYLLYEEWRVEAHDRALSQEVTYPAEPPAYQCFYGSPKTPMDV